MSTNNFVVQGTTFVLQKKAEPRQRLLSVISTGTAVKEVIFVNSNVYFVCQSNFSLLISFLATLLLLQAIEEFISLNQNGGESELQEGEWKMVWSSQVIR